MIDKQAALAVLQDAIDKVNASDNDLTTGLALTKAAASLAQMSALAAASSIPDEIPDSIDVLSPIKNILGDIGDNNGYFNKVTDFITKANAATTEQDLIKLVLSEVVDTNWSFQIDIDGDGKSVSLINGSEVINLAKNILDGKPLDVKTAMLAVTTKLEKEIFGFSVVETVKGLDDLSKILLVKSPADVKLDSVINSLGGVIGGMGDSRLSTTLKGVMSLVTDLNSQRLEAQNIVQTAVQKFDKAKSELLDGKLPEILPDIIPELPITIPILGEDPILPPPNNFVEELVPGEYEGDAELLESASDFQEIISEEDEDYF